jgi:hypothetical protein
MSIDITLAIFIGTLSIAMAVLGGVIATDKRGVRFSFLLMGLISVALVVFQAVRAAESQDELALAVAQVQKSLAQSRSELQQAQQKLFEAQSSLATNQSKLIDITTGGHAFPSVRMFFKDPLGNENLSLRIANRSQQSLYSVSLEVALGTHQVGGSIVREDEPCFSGVPAYAEIAPRSSVNVPCHVSMKSSDICYVVVHERNGEFASTFSWNGDKKIVHSTHRVGSSEVLEEGTDSPYD